MPTLFVLVATRDGQGDDVHRAIRGLDHIKETISLFGEYDIIAKVHAPSMQVGNEVPLRIRELPGVLDTWTLVCVDPAQRLPS